MGLSTSEMEAALIEGTIHIFMAEPDATSVNKVRRYVEESLALTPGFFSNDEWKDKSKDVIKKQVNKLLDHQASQRKGGTPRKREQEKVIKRSSSAVTSPQSPLHKRSSKASRPVKKTESEESEEAKEKVAKHKVNEKRHNAPNFVQESTTKTSDSTPEKKVKRKFKKESLHKSKRIKSSSSEDEEKNDPSGERKVLRQETGQGVEKSESDNSMADKITKYEAVKPPLSDEEDYSDVLDEPPKPSNKKASKTSSKGSKASTTGESGKEPADSGNETEIKKLQSQLVKCGIWKLWQNELKKYGSDARAKIRHLRKMLADVGMEGRFSEAKAREIKETRELLAEAEAAQEMNRLWGRGTGGRAHRNQRSSVKPVLKEEESGTEDESKPKMDTSHDENEGNETTFAAKKRRAQADLVFLGDDSDSG